MSTAKSRLDRDYFERLYDENPDPWNFEKSDYEREKYAATLEVLGDERYRHALEIGCSIGVFTTMLAARCEELLAVDASERAANTAGVRTKDVQNVTVERRTLPEEMPEGRFDLVVASEILYYLPESEMLGLMRQIEAALLPDGTFVVVHWRPKTRTYPLQGEEVHALIRSNTILRHASSKAEPEYLLDVYEKPEHHS